MTAKKKATEPDLNLTGLKEVQAQAKNLKDTMSKRKENWAEIEDMVFMRATTKSSDPGVKLTIDPGPRNKTLGTANLLTAALPTWNVPREKNDPDAETRSSKIEHAANTMWARSNHIQGKRIERQMILSAIAYDEIHLRVVSTKDILDATKGNMAKAAEGENYDERMWQAEIEQARRINERTPYLFKLIPPPVCYPLWSAVGPLIAHYTESDMLVADAKHEFGDRAAKAIGSKQDFKTVTVCEWWDKVYRYTWFSDASDDPIYAEAHGLIFLPIVSQRVVGSDLFLDVARQNEPFLYGVLKSGVWKAKNSILTAVTTNLMALINAGWYYQKQDAEDTLASIDFGVIGNVLQGKGTLTPMAKNIVDQNTQALWSILDGLFEESTIYGTALGEKLAPNMTFSETALLAQQGRLPIVPLQSALKESLAGAMEIAFRWMKVEGGKYDMLGGLKVKEIPDMIEFDVVVEPDLPQDKLMQSQVAQSVTTGPDPLTSKRWARENVLNEGQSDDLQREIWMEQMGTAAFQAGIQETLIIAKQAAEAMTQMIVGQAQQGIPAPPTTMPQQGMPLPPTTQPDGMPMPPTTQPQQNMPAPPTSPFPPAPGAPGQRMV